MPTKTEQSFADKMIADGWEVYHNGFPDFLCVKDNEAILVEVKAGITEKLKAHQGKMITLLSNFTPLKIYRWSPNQPELIPLAPAMSKIKITFERESKFPEWATPEVLKTMKTGGKTLQTIADMFGVTAEAVRQRILKAKES